MPGVDGGEGSWQTRQPTALHRDCRLGPAHIPCPAVHRPCRTLCRPPCLTPYSLRLSHAVPHWHMSTGWAQVRPARVPYPAVHQPCPAVLTPLVPGGAPLAHELQGALCVAPRLRVLAPLHQHLWCGGWGHEQGMGLWVVTAEHPRNRAGPTAAERLAAEGWDIGRK